jgi:hypothetical protein
MSEDGQVTVTPGPPLDGDRPSTDRRRRGRIPLRFRLLALVVVIVLRATATSNTRTWWAHRVHDMTGGSHSADFGIGLVIGLLPLVGIAVGAIAGRNRRGRRGRRVLRMLWFGAIGFIGTDLLAPSLGRYGVSKSTTRVFDHDAPGYLAGVLTGDILWLVLLVVGVLRARAWWRRVTSGRGAPPVHGRDDPGTSPRIIDI